MDLVTIKEEKVQQEKKIKRVASLDFQRGLAIWLMVFLHVFNHIYDYSWVNPATIFQDASFPLAIFILLSAFFGSWAGYFILISSTVNALAMTKKAYSNSSSEKILLKQFLTGVGILVVGRIEQAFGYYGYFGRTFREGTSLLKSATWVNQVNVSMIWRKVFMTEALQIIGWCMIINGFIHYLLIRKNGEKKLVRNLLVYGFLTLLILTLTPFLWKYIDNLNWKIPSLERYHEYGVPYNEYNQHWPSSFLQAENASFKTYILVLLAGDLYPLFPFLSTSFIGSMIGTALAMPKPSKKIPLFSLIGSFVILAIGGFSGIFMNWEPNFERPFFPWYCILLGAQLLTLSLFLMFIDFKGRGEKFANRAIVKYFRTWGMIALSVFVLQIWSLVPRALFNFAFEDINLLNQRFPKNQIGWVFLFAVLTILFYDLIIWIWAQVNFKFSFEWFILRLSKISRTEVSKRLNFKIMLNEIYWVDYKEKFT